MSDRAAGDATAVYSIEALSTGGGRDGHVRTTDGSLDLDLKPPKELGGAGGAANPEALFAAGYAGCFHSAVLGAARRRRTDVSGSSVGARVSLLRDGESVGLAVHLEVVLPGLDRATADELVALAHELCPYSKATRGNIPVTIEVAED